MLIKNLKINTDMQLDIFEKVFLELIERPIYREHLKRMLLAAEQVDMAKADFMLKKLDLEIMERKQKEQKGGSDFFSAN